MASLFARNAVLTPPAFLIAIGLCFILPCLGQRCEPVNIPFCQQFYNTTVFPNILRQETQEEARADIPQYVPLVKTGCSRHLALLVCSVYAPICIERLKTPIPPCRFLCYSARNGCEGLMKRFGLTWPAILDCGRFPKLGKDAKCYSGENIGSIDWPAGTYGIPKPTSGCPWADGFQWKTGWRSQDMNGDYSNNSKSAEFHLDGEVDNKKVNRSFCLKNDTTSDKNRSTWPSGQYCIYKIGTCPEGLTKGHVKWDDDDRLHSLNDKGGTLPDGTYDHNTKIQFCCKTDGNKSDPILLPTKTSFFLLAYNSSKCQMVQWATATLEWIYYDTEDERNSDETGGEFPYQAGKKPKIFFCYYRGCNETLTGLSGTFHSPNYPQKYPDGQYCSWRITVNPGQQIHLTFTDFSLQSENNTDSLYVYDGESGTGEELGVFYGDHPPPKEGIHSSLNHMFVIFKADGDGSYKGFNASYCSVKQAKTAVTTTTEGSEMTTPTFMSKTLYTLDTTSPNHEPTEEGLKNDQGEKSRKKGVNLVAVVVPVVAVVLLVPMLLAAFVYFKRKRTKNVDNGMERDSYRQDGEGSMLNEIPHIDR